MSGKNTHALGRVRCACAGHPIFRPHCKNVWHDSTIGPYLLLTVPIVWFKIGLKCPRSTIFSILGHLCPNFKIASSKCMNWVFVQYICIKLYNTVYNTVY